MRVLLSIMVALSIQQLIKEYSLISLVAFSPNKYSISELTGIYGNLKFPLQNTRVLTVIYGMHSMIVLTRIYGSINYPVA